MPVRLTVQMSLPVSALSATASTTTGGAEGRPLAIALPWFVAVQWENPAFFHYFFVVQHLLPVLGEGSSTVAISSLGARAVPGKPGLENPS